jgi:hypothetical protein
MKRKAMTLFGKIVIPFVLVVSLLGAIAILKWPTTVRFDSPSQAVTTLEHVLRTGNMSAAEAVLGHEAHNLLTAANGRVDHAGIRKFIVALAAREIIVARGGRSEILEVGADGWPFPIPLVRSEGGWRFDSAAGEREVAARRIGQDELFTIQACRAFVDAEREYAAVRRAGVHAYADRIASTRDASDGLYWPSKQGKAPSLLGPDFALAEISKVNGSHTPKSFHGYYFRILTAQGPAARDGAYSYLADGKMIGGFALIAYPARYRVSGVMTFIVNQDGIVFQKDLGPNTTTIASHMKAFDPERGWTNA